MVEKPRTSAVETTELAAKRERVSNATENAAARVVGLLGAGRSLRCRSRDGGVKGSRERSELVTGMVGVDELVNGETVRGRRQRCPAVRVVVDDDEQMGTTLQVSAEVMEQKFA